MSNGYSISATSMWINSTWIIALRRPDVSVICSFSSDLQTLPGSSGSSGSHEQGIQLGVWFTKPDQSVITAEELLELEQVLLGSTQNNKEKVLSRRQ